MKTISIDAIIT